MAAIGIHWEDIWADVWQEVWATELTIITSQEMITPQTVTRLETPAAPTRLVEPSKDDR